MTGTIARSGHKTRHGRLGRSPRRVIQTALAAALLAIAAPSVRAQVSEADEPAAIAPAQPSRPEPQDSGPRRRPELANRLVVLFDFEEKDRHTLPVPLHWFRAQDDPGVPRERPGFPLWNLAHLDDSVAFRGQGSVRLPTQGGSTSLRLSPGVIPVFPGADYLISARVKTRGLVHARARMAARCLDASSRPIPDTQVESEMVLSEGHWRPVSLTVRGGRPDAAFLQIDLEVLQPDRFRRGVLPREHQVWHEDLAGAAWFDDVAVLQLPRIELSTDAPANVLLHPDRPVLSINVRDLTGEELTASMIVQDAAGRVVDRFRTPLQRGQARWTWEPRLEELGWYRASLELRPRGDDGSSPAGASHVDFLWLPADPRAGQARARHAAGVRERRRFGLILTQLRPERAPELPALIGALGTGAVTIPLWSETLQAEQTDGLFDAVFPIVDRLIEDWQEITFSLGRVPAELAAATRADLDDPLSIFQPDADRWRAYLFPFLDRYGQSVRRWQFGRDGDGRAFTDTALPDRLGGAIGVLDRLVPGPLLMIPWRAEHAPTPELPAAGEHLGGLRVLVPHAVPPDAIARYIDSFIGTDTPDTARQREVTFVLEPIPTGLFGHRAAAEDLVRRTVYAWEAMGGRRAVRLALPEPWSDGHAPAGSARPMPTAAAGAWRNLADRLADRRIAGRFPAGDGLECFLLAPAADAPPGRGGALVLWRREQASSETPVVFLGHEAGAVVDVFGNVSGLTSPAGREQDGALWRQSVELAVGGSPVFVESVDVELLRFLASIRLEPEFLSTTVLDHEAALLMTNPWPVAISGRLFILEPGGYRPGAARDRDWNILPRSVDFSVGPGQTVRYPINIGLSGVQEAGEHDMLLQIDLTAARRYDELRFAVPLRLGLPFLELDATARPDNAGRGPGLIVEARLKNVGDEPLTLDVVAFAPGVGRRSLSVGRLMPGEQTLRLFAFPDAATLRGQGIALSVVDAESGSRLNRTVRVD